MPLVPPVTSITLPRMENNSSVTAHAPRDRHTCLSRSCDLKVWLLAPATLNLSRRSGGKPDVTRSIHAMVALLLLVFAPCGASVMAAMPPEAQMTRHGYLMPPT